MRDSSVPSFCVPYGVDVLLWAFPPLHPDFENTQGEWDDRMSQQGLHVLGVAASWPEEWARPRGSCDPSAQRACEASCRSGPVPPCTLFCGGSASLSFSISFLRRQAIAC